MYTFAWEAEFGGHLFDIHIMKLDPNANDFVDSYTQGPVTVFVPRFYFYDTSDGQNRPTSDAFVVDPSSPKWQDQSQDVETPTDQR